MFVFPFPGIFDVGVIGNGILINNYSDHSVLLYAFHVAFMCETSNINHIMLVVVVLQLNLPMDYIQLNNGVTYNIDFINHVGGGFAF